jgi:hypothetical protein
MIGIQRRSVVGVGVLIVFAASVVVWQLCGASGVASASASAPPGRTVDPAVFIHAARVASGRDSRLETPAVVRLKARAAALVRKLDREHVAPTFRSRVTPAAARAVAEAYSMKVPAPAAVSRCVHRSEVTLKTTAKARPPVPARVSARPKFVSPVQVRRLVEECLSEPESSARTVNARKGA